VLTQKGNKLYIHGALGAVCPRSRETSVLLQRNERREIKVFDESQALVVRTLVFFFGTAYLFVGFSQERFCRKKGSGSPYGQ